MSNLNEFNVQIADEIARQISTVDDDRIDPISVVTRMPTLILMDTSESMKGHEGTMVESIKSLYNSLLENSITRNSVELGIMAFNEMITILEPLREIKKHEKKGELDFECKYQTCTGLALLHALKHLEKRVDVYRSKNRLYYSPILFVFSDGRPFCNDSKVREEDRQAREKCIEKIKELVKKNQLVVISYELGNDCDHDFMCSITGLPDDRHVKKVFDREAMNTLFEITSSMIITSSKRGNSRANDLSISELLDE